MRSRTSSANFMTSRAIVFNGISTCSPTKANCHEDSSWRTCWKECKRWMWFPAISWFSGCTIDARACEQKAKRWARKSMKASRPLPTCSGIGPSVAGFRSARTSNLTSRNSSKKFSNSSEEWAKSEKKDRKCLKWSDLNVILLSFITTNYLFSWNTIPVESWTEILNSTNSSYA